MPLGAWAWEPTLRGPGRHGFDRPAATAFEAFHRHEFVAATAPATVRTLPRPLPALHEEMAPPPHEELPPQEMPKVRTIDEEDDLRFRQSKEDRQIARLGAAMDEKIEKLEDRFLTGDLQSLVVPLPSTPVVPAASKVHFLQGKPSTVSTSVANPDDELDALLHRVDGVERRLIRGPPSDRLEGIASALARAPRMGKAGTSKNRKGVFDVHEFHEHVGLATSKVHVMQPFMTSPGMEEFQHGLGVFLGYDSNEVLPGPIAESWDEACVTLAYRKGAGHNLKAVSFPTCRGSAFVTGEFRGVRPLVSSDLMLAEPKKLRVDGKLVDCTDFVQGKEIEFTLSTGDSWLVVFPPGMGWVCKAWPFKLLAAEQTPLQGAAIQVAMLSGKNPGCDVQRWASLVRAHAGAYPVASGVNFKVGDNADDGEVSFNWADYVRTVPGHGKKANLRAAAILIW
ncbi:unnamed protein product [Symbiodinium natans]|uniref:Glycosyl hydrolase family 81 N-terminal domain-containing protein n=1 Tax=Symbiodinium natans TaxID=878477 RepID=A0A812K002_9DINO|nr:unnamed protein product [Symbiodinium natans]